MLRDAIRTPSWIGQTNCVTWLDNGGCRLPARFSGSHLIGVSVNSNVYRRYELSVKSFPVNNLFTNEVAVLQLKLTPILFSGSPMKYSWPKVKAIAGPFYKTVFSTLTDLWHLFVEEYLDYCYLLFFCIWWIPARPTERWFVTW